MARHISSALLLLIMLAIPVSGFAAPDKDKDKKKKRNQTEQIDNVPQMDVLPAKAKPHESLADVGQVGQVKNNVSNGAGTASNKVVYGSHTANLQRGGIDVSHYNGRIDWAKLASTGKVLYAYCKATESTGFVDDTFKFNAAEARKNGIPVGAYHFFSPTTPGAAQFEHFKRTVDMSTQDIIPMLDVEVRGKASLQDFQASIQAWIDGFIATYHFKPLIYASLHFYNKYLAGVFDDYYYMIAKYGEGTPNPQGPIKFAMWQYSPTGRIDGIKGAVDMSHFIDHFDVKDILIKNQHRVNK